MFVLGQIGYWKTELSPNDWARSKFQDIPSTCYFALVTMTTVGYGDIYPLSPAGQTFAAIFCTAGVVSLRSNAPQPLDLRIPSFHLTLVASENP